MSDPFEKPPRILHIAESAQGGVGTYLAEILPDQARRFGGTAVRALVPAEHAAHVSGVDRHLLATWRRGDRSPFAVARFAWAVRREIARFRPTIVHAHSSVAGGVLRLMARRGRPRYRIVYCPHGWAFDRRSLPAKKRLIERIEHGLAPYTDAIVLISAHERDEAIRIGIDPGRLSLILNGIGSRPPAHAARWNDRRLKVLFVGRLDQQKGYDTFLDAIAPLDDRIAVRVIGEAVAGKAQLRGSHAENLGWRSLAEVATEIAAADVVVMPSRWEGFGLVALEAMRERRAVLATAVGGLREIVVDGVTGRLVAPDHPGQLMRALTDHDVATWRAMGVAGRARYEACFTAERMNREIAALYAALPAPAVGPRRRIEAHA